MPQILILVAAVIVLGGGYFFFSSSAPTEVSKAPENTAVVTPPTPVAPTTPVNEPVPSPSIPPATPTAMKKKYTDGQYSAEGSYVIPNKEVEKMVVSLTLKDGIITAVDFTSNPEETGSKVNQKKFSDGYKDLVVGKDIDTIALTVVNGSSLTPVGFMEALKTIKEKAHSAA